MRYFVMPHPADTFDTIQQAFAALEQVIGDCTIEYGVDPAAFELSPIEVEAPTVVVVADPRHPSVTPLARGSIRNAVPLTVVPQAEPDPTEPPATADDRIPCPDCGKLVKPAGLNIHRHRAHGNPPAETRRDDGKIVCELCGKAVVKRNMRRHLTDSCKGSATVRTVQGPPPPIAPNRPPVDFGGGPIARTPVDHDRIRRQAAEGI